MDRLGQAWKAVEERQGRALNSPDITAKAVMGTALMLALEHYYTEDFDLRRAVSSASRGFLNGF